MTVGGGLGYTKTHAGRRKQFAPNQIIGVQRQAGIELLKALTVAQFSRATGVVLYIS